MKKFYLKKLPSIFAAAFLLVGILAQSACRADQNGQPSYTPSVNDEAVLVDVRNRLSGFTLTATSGARSVLTAKFVTEYSQTDLDTGVSGSGTGESAVDKKTESSPPNIYWVSVPRLVWAGSLNVELSREATLLSAELLDPNDELSSLAIDNLDAPPAGDWFVLLRYRHEWNEGSKQGSAVVEFVFELTVPAIS